MTAGMVFDRTFFKFILVGIVNTVIGCGLMFVLYNLFNVNYWLASAANYIVGSVLSFFLNKYFTFAVKGWTPFMVIAFIMNIAFSYFVAYGMAKPVMNYLLRNNPLAIRENAALLTGMCLFVGLNYIGQRLVVFKSRVKSGASSGCSKTSSFGTTTSKNAVLQGFSLKNGKNLSKRTEFWNRLSSKENNDEDKSL
jgi:putative flippase GtrA